MKFKLWRRGGFFFFFYLFFLFSTLTAPVDKPNPNRRELIFIYQVLISQHQPHLAFPSWLDCSAGAVIFYIEGPLFCLSSDLVFFLSLTVGEGEVSPAVPSPEQNIYIYISITLWLLLKLLLWGQSADICFTVSLLRWLIFFSRNKKVWNSLKA